jgi:hypothetical protein
LELLVKVGYAYWNVLVVEYGVNGDYFRTLLRRV